MTEYSFNSKRILIIDEEPTVGRLFKMLLSTHGYQVEVVSTGQEAIKAISDEFDLILLDLSLPDFQTFKICQEFKSNPRTRNIPLMIVSNFHNNGKRIEDFHLGADDYLSKPFEADDLFVHVEKLLRRQNPITKNQGAAASEEEYQTICELKRIIDCELIIPYFQPIYYLKPLKLLGLEVLSRPQTLGVLANPEVLFKAALHHGVYFDMEMIGWRQALKSAADVFNGEQLFLNCSPHLLESEKFRTVKNVFDDCGMGVDNVFLEITERSKVSNYETFFSRLNEYRKDGFKIAVDDVGGGYSSLETIVETKPEVAKLDGHIITGLAEDPYKRSIVKLIVAFCRENSIICIAEGIETKKDFDLLVELGVEAGQGYYLYRPMAKIDLKAMHHPVMV